MYTYMHIHIYIYVYIDAYTYIYIYKMNINLQKNREMCREKEDTTRGSTVLPARSTAACLTSLGHERQELARLRGDRDKI